jgi:hypothetical protein
MTTNIKQTEEGTTTYLTGRPIDFDKRIEGNPQNLVVDFTVNDDGSLQVKEAWGEVKVNQYATRVKRLRARSVQRVLRNAGITRQLTVA